MIALVRVDNRLIHGQVVSTWIPHLQVDEVVVADEEAASSALMRAAMTMALPPTLDVAIARPGEVDWSKLAKSGKRVLVLVRDVADAARAADAGLPLAHLNVGNVHFGEGRRAISPSVFLSERELSLLEELAARGVEVEARAVPSDAALGLPDLKARLEATR